jgi:hypothetical protein
MVLLYAADYLPDLLGLTTAQQGGFLVSILVQILCAATMLGQFTQQD